MSTKVLVLGASGMLGSMVTKVLAEDDSLAVTGTVRSSASQLNINNVTWTTFDAETATADQIAELIKDHQWVVNAIGIIKPYIHDDNPAETERAVRVNALFPHLLAKAAEQSDAKVIQIATDCAYSGAKGAYTENDTHDALDVYGKTKSLGEVPTPQMHHLRCSIIGPELKHKLSLLEWFLGQPQDATVNGYTNHQWNGVTTYHFGRICRGIITNDLEIPNKQHIIPGNALSKADLLKAFARSYQRDDLTIKPGEAQVVIDRTLQTNDPESNIKIWQAAGYNTPPTLEQMIQEMADYGPIQ